VRWALFSLLTLCRQRTAGTSTRKVLCTREWCAPKRGIRTGGNSYVISEYCQLHRGFDANINKHYQDQLPFYNVVTHCQGLYVTWLAWNVTGVTKYQRTVLGVGLRDVHLRCNDQRERCEIVSMSWVTSCHVVWRHVTWCDVMSRGVMSCHVVWRHVTWCEMFNLKSCKYCPF
jgi:hypothetical protein